MAGTSGNRVPRGSHVIPNSGPLIIYELYKIARGAAQHRGKQIGITAAPWLFA